MDKKRFETIQEYALVALTYIEYDQNTNRAEAEANKKMVLETYTKASINEGAMLALTVLLAYESYALEKPIGDRIQQVRDILRDSLHPTDPTKEG